MATLMLRTPTESARNEDFQSSFFFLEENFIVGTGEAIRTEWNRANKERIKLLSNLKDFHSNGAEAREREREKSLMNVRYVRVSPEKICVVI